MDFRQFRLVLLFMAIVIGFLVASATYHDTEPETRFGFFGVWVLSSIVSFGAMFAIDHIQMMGS